MYGDSMKVCLNNNNNSYNKIFNNKHRNNQINKNKIIKKKALKIQFNQHNYQFYNPNKSLKK